MTARKNRNSVESNVNAQEQDTTVNNPTQETPSNAQNSTVNAQTDASASASAPSAQIDGLDTVSTALGFVSVKSDAPARFDIRLRTDADGNETVWLKHLPIETDADGFGLHGYIFHRTWTVSADGKKAEGFLCFNERKESYTKSPYATTDKANFVYRSIGNMVNRAASLAVDPGMTQKQVVAAHIATLKQETETQASRADSAEIATRVLVAIMTNTLAGLTRADVETARAHSITSAIPSETFDSVLAQLTS